MIILRVSYVYVVCMHIFVCYFVCIGDCSGVAWFEYDCVHVFVLIVFHTDEFY